VPPKKEKEKANDGKAKDEKAKDEKAKDEKANEEKAKEDAAEGAKVEAEPGAADPKLPAEMKFLPRFVLFSDQKTKTADGRQIPKAYLDRIIPVAMDPIRLREDPRRTMLNSVEISEKPIQLSTDTVDNAVWGLAT